MLPATLPDVVGDPDLLDTVVGQLLENAVKYSPDGGVVTLSAEADGDRLRIDVADRGVGIAEADRGRVFERFVQSGPSGPGDRRAFGGVGLGLYIVRRLVESQGGQVAAAARAGGGAVFSVWLPTSGA